MFKLMGRLLTYLVNCYPINSAVYCVRFMFTKSCNVLIGIKNWFQPSIEILREFRRDLGENLSPELAREVLYPWWCFRYLGGVSVVRHTPTAKALGSDCVSNGITLDPREELLYWRMDTDYTQMKFNRFGITSIPTIIL